MDLDALASLPGVHDVIVTATALYVITHGEDIPPIYTDKTLHVIPQHDLLRSPHLLALIQGTSKKGKVQPITACALYRYSYDGLEQSAKQAVSHALSGSGGRKSLLASLDGEKLGRGALTVPVEYERTLDAFFDEHEVTYTKKRIYVEDEQ